MTADEVKEALANSTYEVTSSAEEYIATLTTYHEANPGRNPAIPKHVTNRWLKAEADQFAQAKNITIINVEAVRTYLKAKDIFCPF